MKFEKCSAFTVDITTIMILSLSGSSGGDAVKSNRNISPFGSTLLPPSSGIRLRCVKYREQATAVGTTILR